MRNLLPNLSNIFSPATNGVVKVFSFKFPLPIVAVLALMGLTSWATVGFARRQPEVLGLVKGPSIIQEEQQDLIAEVGKLINLPKKETPNVATVTDLDKIKDQVFFKNAKNGDKVLIYTNAKKAVLYRPSENRIIEVGVVNINQQPSEETASPSPSPSPSPSASPKPTESPTS